MACHLTVAAEATEDDATRFLFTVDPAQRDAILEQLRSQDNVINVKPLFGNQLLVVTDGDVPSTNLGNVQRIVKDFVIDRKAIGSIDPETETETRTNPNLAGGIKSRVTTISKARLTSDPLNIFQWAYQNFGYDGGVAGLDTGVHAIAETGAGVVIALASTGADYTHEDLVGSLWVNSGEIRDNGLDDDSNGFVDDYFGPGPLSTGDTLDQFGEGTALTGIMVANRDNGLGISGISPGAKVLACNIALPSGQLSVIDILVCIDYVIFQKTQRNQNIPIFVAGFQGWAPLDELLEPAMQALFDAGILVITPTFNGKYAGGNLDDLQDVPSSMDFPNILAASVFDRFASPANRSSGLRMTDILLPGSEIVTTWVGHTGTVDGNDFLVEDFSSIPASWQLTGGWEYAQGGGINDSGSLQIHVGTPNYLSRDQLIELPAMDLSALATQPPYFSFMLKAENIADSIPSFRRAELFLEVLSPIAGTWIRAKTDQLNTSGPAWQHITAFLDPAEYGSTDFSNVRLRFSFYATDRHTPDIIIDDFVVGSQPPIQPFSNNYRNFYGPGASAAIAASMAAIIMEARPELSVPEVKNLIISSATPYASGSGSIERAGSLWNNEGTGALQCAGVFTNRLVTPIFDRPWFLALGQQFLLRVTNTDCAMPGIEPLITERVGGGGVTFVDDGSNVDQRAGDGDFAATWSSETPVDETLTFPDGQKIDFIALSHYEYESVPFQWRTLLQEPEFPDRELVAPFPVLVGDLDPSNPLSVPLFQGPNPGLMMWWGATSLDPSNDVYVLPDIGTTRSGVKLSHPGRNGFQMHPVFFDGILDYPVRGWPNPEREVQGQAPNREWIIEWKHYSYRECEGDSVSVQLILFENSPNVLLNYLDMGPDCKGEIPRVFLHHNIDSWQVFDAPIAAATSLLLKPSSGPIDRAPSLTRSIPDQTLVHGQLFTLDLSQYFSDPEGDELSYFVGRDSDLEFVSIDDSGLLTARFPWFSTSEIPLTTVVVGAYDGKLATRTSFGVTFDNQFNRAPQQIQPLPQFEGPVGGVVNIELDQYFSDPDGDPLQYIDLGGEQDHWIIGPENKLTLLAGASGGQIEPVEILVTDGQYSFQASTTAIWIDYPATAPELLQPIPDQTVRVGGYFRLPLTPYFQTDPWTSISYVPNSSDPLPLQVGGFIGKKVLHGSFDNRYLTNSPYQIEITAIRNNSNNEETRTTFQLTILPENEAPSISGGNTISITVGQSVNIDLASFFSDPEGQNLHFVIAGLPSGLQVSGNGVITGTLNTEGRYDIDVRVTDDLGGSTISTITINATKPSTVQPTPPVSGGGGGVTGPFALLFFVVYLALRRRSCI